MIVDHEVAELSNEIRSTSSATPTDLVFFSSKSNLQVSVIPNITKINTIRHISFLINKALRERIRRSSAWSTVMRNLLDVLSDFIFLVFYFLLRTLQLNFGPYFPSTQGFRSVSCYVIHRNSSKNNNNTKKKERNSIVAQYFVHEQRLQYELRTKKVFTFMNACQWMKYHF